MQYLLQLLFFFPTYIAHINVHTKFVYTFDIHTLLHTHTQSQYILCVHITHLCIYSQEKVGDSVAQSTDASSPTTEENKSHPTSPAAKSPQNKLPPPKPEPLAAAAGDQEEGETGDGMILYACSRI